MGNNSGDAYITVWMYLVPLNIHLKMVKIVNCMVCVFNQYFFKGSESINNSIIWTTHCIILFLQQLYEAGAFIILIL